MAEEEEKIASTSATKEEKVEASLEEEVEVVDSEGLDDSEEDKAETEAEVAPDHAVIIENQSGRFWRLNLSSLSHCEWSGPELKIYFLTSNGEKIVRIYAEEQKSKSKSVWLKLIERIEGGSDIISPYELDGEKFLIEVLPTKD